VIFCFHATTSKKQRQWDSDFLMNGYGEELPRARRKYPSVISDRLVLSIPQDKNHNQIKSRPLVNQKQTHMQGAPLARTDPISRKEKEESPIPFWEGKDCEGRGGGEAELRAE
jgi:hypothetical protein